MESKFSKQITTYCRLNFSNEIIKEPKPLFYPKNIPQKTILFRKKCQKKSLKQFNTDKFLYSNKSPQKQSFLFRKKSLKKERSIESLKDRMCHEKKPQKNDLQNQSVENFLFSFQETKQKTYKSLEREPLKRPEQKININQELKNYQFKTRQTQKKMQPLQKPSIPILIAQRSSSNLNKSTAYYLPSLKFQEVKKIHLSTSIINEIIQLPRNQTNMNSIKSFQNKNIFAVRNSVESQSSNLTFIQPLKLNQISSLEKTSTISTIEPQQIKKAPQNINFTVQKNPILNSQQLNKFFGEIDIKEGIKEDLIASIGLQSIRSHFESKPPNPSFIKQSDSLKSTYINSDSQLQKIQCDSDFFKNMDMNKKSQFDHASIKESNIGHHQEFSDKNSFLDPQFKRVQIFKFENLIQNQATENIYKDSISQDEFNEKFQIREKFRRIISVYSECETSSESENSIIIDNHPKDSKIARPIKTLF